MWWIKTVGNNIFLPQWYGLDMVQHKEQTSHIFGFPGFFRRLMDSPSTEVRVVSELAAGWAQSVTSVNLKHLQKLTGLDPVHDSLQQMKDLLPVKEVPVSEQWRLGLLDHLLALRAEVQTDSERSKSVVAMLASLCST